MGAVTFIVGLANLVYFIHSNPVRDLAEVDNAEWAITEDQPDLPPATARSIQFRCKVIPGRA